MKVSGVKKALERIDEIECLVMTSTFKIYMERMKKETFKLNEEDETITCDEISGLTSYVLDVNDIDVIVFNNGNHLNSNFPI